MKNSYLLMEVIISILLIFGVVLSMFQIKENNFSLYERIIMNDKFTSALSLVTLNNDSKINQNSTDNLKDVINLNNDFLRNIFDDMDVKIKREITDEKSLFFPNGSVEVKISQSEFSLNNQFNKKIYKIEFD